jgi:hypothetical protein
VRHSGWKYPCLTGQLGAICCDGTIGEVTHVKRKLTLLSIILLTGLLAAVLLPSGCGGPTEDPARFVGHWDREYPPDYRPSYPQTLEFRGDGTAAGAGGAEPHTQGFTWMLYRGKLVLTPREGGAKSTYDFRFEGTDKLTLIAEDGEIPWRRSEKSSEEPSDQPSEGLPEEPPQ